MGPAGPERRAAGLSGPSQVHYFSGQRGGARRVRLKPTDRLVAEVVIDNVGRQLRRADVRRVYASGDSSATVTGGGGSAAKTAIQAQFFGGSSVMPPPLPCYYLDTHFMPRVPAQPHRRPPCRPPLRARYCFPCAGGRRPSITTRSRARLQPPCSVRLLTFLLAALSSRELPRRRALTPLSRARSLSLCLAKLTRKGLFTDSI